MEEFSEESELRPYDGRATEGYHDYVCLRRHGMMILGTISGYGHKWFVKSLAPEARDITGARQMLEKEYSILVPLHHPGIVKVVALQELPEAGLSIIMEYGGGEHLDEYLKHATRSRRMALSHSLVEAVAYLHSQGVMHLDLKPANVLVGGSAGVPQVCIIDFNMSDTAAYIYNKEVGGTPRYAAPEQMKAGYVARPSADVWALGKLLREIGASASWKAVAREAGKDDPLKRPQDAGALLMLHQKIARRRKSLLWGGSIAATLVALGCIVWLALPAYLQPPAVTTMTIDSIAPPPVATHSTDTMSVVVPAAPEQAKTAPPSPLGAESPAAPVRDKYDEEHDRVMAAAAKRMAEEESVLKQEMAAIAADTTLHKGTRLTKLLDVINASNSRIWQPVHDFARSCPDEVFKRHDMSWCSGGDPMIEEAWRRYEQLKTAMFQEYAK